VNYSRIYNLIIERAKNENRIKGNGIYYERHHIIPKCLGGSNDSKNLVLLTGREHFICHHLLVRIHPNNAKLVHAFWLMCNVKNLSQQNRHIPSASVYQEARELNAKLGASEETKRKMSRSRTGLIQSAETKQKIGISNSKPKVRITCTHCGIEGGGSSNMQRWHFDNCKKKPGNENIKRQSSNTGIKTVCPHCNIIGGINIMHRWHFENCKQKNNLELTKSLLILT